MPVELTGPQQDALHVLCCVREQEGDRGPRWVEGWKRSSTMDKVPRVNMRAVHALVVAKLAEVQVPPPWRWSPYTHDERYRATDEGMAWRAS